MATLVNLRNLLEHQIEDLYSAEEQIIDALPLMAENAKDRELTKALKEHLRITKAQLKRLDQVKKILMKNSDMQEERNDGFLERMFGSGSTKCKGMEGLIEEGEKMMGEDMDPNVMDAAIIASSQKIEHYEISGYGTARAYARELGIREVERLLAATLKEEYTSDKLLNQLAINKVNIKAEGGGGQAPRGVNASKNRSNRGSSSSSRNSSTKSSSKGSTSKRPASKKSSGNKSGSSKRSR